MNYNSWQWIIPVNCELKIENIILRTNHYSTEIYKKIELPLIDLELTEEKQKIIEFSPIHLENVDLDDTLHLREKLQNLPELFETNVYQKYITTSNFVLLIVLIILILITIVVTKNKLIPCMCKRKKSTNIESQ